MVTLVSQNLSEFDLHVRAILGLPIPNIQYRIPAASAVILADREAKKVSFDGLERALALKNTEVRIFRKPDSRPYRRMGVALANAGTISQARKTATKAASLIKIRYEEAMISTDKRRQPQSPTVTSSP